MQTISRIWSSILTKVGRSVAGGLVVGGFKKSNINSCENMKHETEKCLGTPFHKKD